MATFFHKLGVERAIIQAPMAGVSTPEMAAAVSNAGGLGSIAVGAVSAEGARDMTTNINAGGFFSMSDMRSAAHLIRAAFCSRVVPSRVI